MRPMLGLVLCAIVLVGCSGSGEPPEPIAAPTPAPIPESAAPAEQAPASVAPGELEVPGFAGFFVPAGGTGGPPPHGGTSMVIYQYPRPLEAVAAELRSIMSSHAWQIESDETSPRGSVRLSVINDGRHMDVRVAGEGASSSVIITSR